MVFFHYHYRKPHRRSLRGYILYCLSPNGSHFLHHFHIAYFICGLFGLISLGFTLKLYAGKPPNRETNQNKISLIDAWKKLSKGIKEIMSDYRIIITSNMEGIQNLSVGALEAFLPIYAVTVAGLTAFQAGVLWGRRFLLLSWQSPLWEKSLTDMAESLLSFWECGFVRFLLLVFH